MKCSSFKQIKIDQENREICDVTCATYTIECKIKYEKYDI